ncbi:hypothetical protein C5688_08695 [Methylocystis sp. MitZ-2018]|nr:hypothetical protein C5688_08695 [Methylocystis sp. MitZ-2018]
MAEAMLKGTVGEAAKDAYTALKQKVSTWAGSKVDSLEEAPDSKRLLSEIAKAVDAQSRDERTALRELAQTLLAQLKEGGPIGVDLGKLSYMQAELEGLTVLSGTGVRLKEGYGGTLKISNVRVGGGAEHSEKPGEDTEKK